MLTYDYVMVMPNIFRLLYEEKSKSLVFFFEDSKVFMQTAKAWSSTKVKQGTVVIGNMWIRVKPTQVVNSEYV